MTGIEGAEIKQNHCYKTTKTKENGVSNGTEGTRIYTYLIFEVRPIAPPRHQYQQFVLRIVAASDANLRQKRFRDVELGRQSTVLGETHKCTVEVDPVCAFDSVEQNIVRVRRQRRR